MSKSVKDVCDEFLDTKEQAVSLATLKSYRTHINAFKEVFGGMMIENVTKTMIEDYYKSLINSPHHYKSSSLRTKKTVLSSLFNEAKRAGYIKENVWDTANIQLRRVLPKASTMVLPTPEQFHKLLEEAEKYAHWYYVLLYLASVTGMRRGELLGLKWKCVDKDTKTITINRDSLMMIVDDDDKSKKEILKDSLLFFHISSLLRFPLVYERSLMTYLNIDVDDFTSTPSHKWDTRLTFSPKEVSEMLGVPLSTIYSLCYNESLKAFKIGTHWRIHRKGLYEFLRHSIDTSITL